MTPELLEKLRSFVGLRELTAFSGQGLIGIDQTIYRVHMGRTYHTWIQNSTHQKPTRMSRGRYNYSTERYEDEIPAAGNTWDDRESKTLDAIEPMTQAEFFAFEDVAVVSTPNRLVTFNLLDDQPGFLYGIDENSGDVIVEFGERYHYEQSEDLTILRTTTCCCAYYRSGIQPAYLRTETEISLVDSAPIVELEPPRVERPAVDVASPVVTIEARASGSSQKARRRTRG